MRVATVAVPLGFLAVFFAYPVLAIVGRGLVPQWSVDLDPLGDVVTDAALRHIAVVHRLAGDALDRADPRGRAPRGVRARRAASSPDGALVRALVTVPFVLPTVVVASAFVALLGEGGPLGALGLDQTLGAILVAHVFFNYSVVVRTVGSLWAHLDPRPEEAARMLGASRFRTFREVTLPSLRPAIAAAAAVVFLFTFTSFGVILILGGPGTATLETEIYRQTAQFLNLPLAAALTVVQLVAIVLLLLLTSWIEGRQRVTLSLRAAAETLRRPRTPGARAFVAANLALMAVLLGVPVGVLLFRSFDTPSGLGLDFYRALGEVHAGSTLFVEPVHAIANSLRFAVAATAIAVIVGGCAAFALARRHADAASTRWCRSPSVSPRSRSASGSSSRSTTRRSTCGARGGWSRSRRRWSPYRSSCG